MADELKVTLSTVYEKGQLKYTFQPGQLKLPQSAQGYTNKTVTVETSAETDLSLSELATQGYALLQSLEATTTGNHVFYGPKTSTGGMLKFGKLNPKQIHMVHLNSTTTLRWQANTADVEVQVTVYEN